MLPLPDEPLRLGAVAEYWSREIQGVRTAADIRQELLSAFWRGELEVVSSTGDQRVDRRGLLAAIRIKPEHPGFTVVDSVDMIESMREEHPDGSVTIDLRKHIVLPRDKAEWTEGIIVDACSTLATLSFQDFSDLFKPVLLMLSTSKGAVADYCRYKSYAPPRFWFGTKPSTQWTSKRERDFAAWLRKIATGPKQKPKTAYFVDASAEFSGLPKKSFNRVWNDVVPEQWKRSGPIRAPRLRTRSITS
jgi:hypothetical protein